MGLPTIIYTVDAHDRIVSVNEAWDRFATQNEGTAYLAEHIVGRNLFEFIGDDSTRQIYRQMLVRIRGGTDLEYRYRCDSLDCRRLMEMRVRATNSEGGVEFRSITLDATQRTPMRTPMRLPQADGAEVTEPAEFQRACGWCNRLDVNGVWLEMEEALPLLLLHETPTAPTLTHGMCEACLAKMKAELDLPTGA